MLAFRWIGPGAVRVRAVRVRAPGTAPTAAADAGSLFFRAARLLALRTHQPAPAHHVAVVVVERAREGVPARAVGDEVQFVRLGRRHDRPERRRAWVDRKSVLSGKRGSVCLDLGGRRIINKKKNKT